MPTAAPGFKPPHTAIQRQNKGIIVPLRLFLRAEKCFSEVPQQMSLHALLVRIGSHASFASRKMEFPLTGVIKFFWGGSTWSKLGNVLWAFVIFEVPYIREISHITSPGEPGWKQNSAVGGYVWVQVCCLDATRHTCARLQFRREGRS